MHNKSKEKKPVTIYKILHKLISILKSFYELCVWVKAIIDLFF